MIQTVNSVGHRTAVCQIFGTGNVLSQDFPGPVIEYTCGGLGPECIVNLQPVAPSCRILRCTQQHFCRRVKQRHQIRSVRLADILIARYHPGRHIGDLKFADHKPGSGAVCNLIAAKTSQIIRQVDHAVAAVYVADLISDSDS